MMITKTPDAPLTVRREIVRDPRIWLGVIAYGGQVYGQWVSSVMQAMATLQVSIGGSQHPLIGNVAEILGDSLVCRARNNMAHYFLRGRDEDLPDGRKITRQFDFLLFVDTDIIFRPEHVGRLYSHAVTKGHKVVCGLYPIKALKPRFVCNALPDRKPNAEGIVSVRDAGTGLMLIHRDVFARLIETFGEEMSYTADDDEAGEGETRYDFFAVGPRYDPWSKRRRYLSEDYYFTQRCNDSGIDVIMDTRIQARHIGQMIYPVTPDVFFDALPVYAKLRDAAGQAAVAHSDTEAKEDTEDTEDKENKENTDTKDKEDTANDSGPYLPIGAKSVAVPRDDRAQADNSDLERRADHSQTRAADDAATDVSGRDGGGADLGGTDANPLECATAGAQSKQ